MKQANERREETDMKTYRLFATSAALAIAAFGTTAYAQDAETSEGGIADIVVTAQKRAENVQDVPIAITAVTSETLESRGVRSVADISNFTPNVQLEQSAPIFASSQILTGFIRGIGQNDISSSLEPGVGVYLDGVILARSVGANVDLLDIERIEVLKGPQGTLFGRNTIGGAISIVTRDPEEDFAVRGELTYGSRQRFEMRATVDVPLAATLRSQFSFSTRNQKGYQKIIPFPGDTGVTDEYNLNIIPRNKDNRRGNTDSYVFRGKLLWEASPDLTVKFAADYAKADEQSSPISLVATDTNALAPAPTYAAVYNTCISAPGFLFGAGGPLAFLAPICGPRGGGVPGGAALPGLAGYNFANATPRLAFGDQFITNDIDTTYGNGTNRSLVRTWSATGTIDYRISDAVALKSTTGYRKVKSDLANDLDGSPILIASTLASLREKQFSQELQLNIDAFGDRLKSVLGAYYFYESNSNLENAYLSEGLGQFYGPYTNKNKSYALYTHNSVKLTDALSLTLGARYTKDKKEFEAGQSDINLSLLKLGLFVPGQLPNPADPTRLYPLGVQRDTYNNFSMRVGAEYKITDRVMVYGSYAEAFKSGGYTTRLSIPTPGNVPPRFDPEEAQTYEIGLKSQFLDRRVQLNLAAFTTKYSNLQVIVVRGISPFIENAGQARIKGFEAELQAVPIERVRLSASVGYLDAKYIALDSAVTFSLNDRFVNTPKWSVSTAADLDLLEGAGGTFTLHGDYAYKSTQARDAVNTAALLSGAQNIVNANLRWRRADKALELVAGVQNATDDRYIVTGTQVDAVGATTVTYSRPREYYVTARVRF
jgi:iron complex outermembrane recepter protein